MFKYVLLTFISFTVAKLPTVSNSRKKALESKILTLR